MLSNGATGSHHISTPSITTSPTQIVPVRRSQTDGGIRVSLIIQNQSATDVYLGNNAITAAANGGLLLKGGQTPPATFTDVTCGDAWYGIVVSGPVTLWVDEIY